MYIKSILLVLLTPYLLHCWTGQVNKTINALLVYSGEVQGSDKLHFLWEALLEDAAYNSLERPSWSGEDQIFYDVVLYVTSHQIKPLSEWEWLVWCVHMSSSAPSHVLETLSNLIFHMKEKCLSWLLSNILVFWGAQTSDVIWWTWRWDESKKSKFTPTSHSQLWPQLSSPKAAFCPCSVSNTTQHDTHTHTHRGCCRPQCWQSVKHEPLLCLTAVKLSRPVASRALLGGYRWLGWVSVCVFIHTNTPPATTHTQQFIISHLPTKI